MKTLDKDEMGRFDGGINALLSGTTADTRSVSGLEDLCKTYNVVLRSEMRDITIKYTAARKIVIGTYSLEVHSISRETTGNLRKVVDHFGGFLPRVIMENGQRPPLNAFLEIGRAHV